MFLRLNLSIFTAFFLLLACSTFAGAPVSTNTKYQAGYAFAPRGEFAEERLHLDLDYHGYYMAERLLVQDAIAHKILSPGVAVEHPRIIFIAGSMGAGKTHTLEFLARGRYLDLKSFVNPDPDIIKAMIPDFDELYATVPEQAATLVHRESTYIQEIVRERALGLRLNIIIDGSLRDMEYHRDLIERIRKTHPNYQIEIVHVLTDPDIAYERVKARAEKTKRHVPKEVFDASIDPPQRSVDALSPLVDRVLIIANDDEPILLGTRINKPALDAQKKHVSFDLDWTLIAPSSTAKSVMVNGVEYSISPGSEEVFAAVKKEPDLEISVFSGGTYSRNIKFLEKTPLRDGSSRSLFDVVYRALSRLDLTQVKMPALGERFSDWNKKDLRKISANQDNVVLVDDIEHFAMPGQIVLHLGQTYDVFQTYTDAKAAWEKASASGESTKYLPETEQAWFNERYKIPAVYMIIIDALRAARADRNISFAKEVQRLAKLPRGPFVRRGLHALGIVTGEPAAWGSTRECVMNLLPPKSSQ